MIDWVPVAFLTFKVLIFGACMFFAIKWHYDQGKKVMDRRALIRRGSKFFAIFMLALLCVLAVSVWAYHLEFLHQLRTIAVHQS